MLRTLKIAGKYWMLLSLFLLAACSAPTAAPAAPTADLNLLRTEVAATVLARVPEYCAMTPTVTFTASVTPTATQTVTPSPTGPTPTVPGGTGEAGSGNRLKWVSQIIDDGTRMAPNSTFNMTWRVQNVGTTTWSANYRLRHWSGERFGAPAEVLLNQEVAPGEVVDITIPMKAPALPGEYRSDWVMANELRGNFNEPIYLKIIIVGPGTLAPTLPAPTATVTVQPTQAATPTMTVTP